MKHPVGICLDSDGGWAPNARTRSQTIDENHCSRGHVRLRFDIAPKAQFWFKHFEICVVQYGYRIRQILYLRFVISLTSGQVNFVACPLCVNWEKPCRYLKYIHTYQISILFNSLSIRHMYPLIPTSEWSQKISWLKTVGIGSIIHSEPMVKFDSRARIQLDSSIMFGIGSWIPSDHWWNSLMISDLWSEKIMDRNGSLVYIRLILIYSY